MIGKIRSDRFRYFLCGRCSVRSNRNGARGRSQFQSSNNHPAECLPLQTRSPPADVRAALLRHLLFLCSSADAILISEEGRSPGSPSRTFPFLSIRTSFSGVIKLLLIPVGVARNVPSSNRTETFSIVGCHPSFLPHFMTHITDLFS